MIVEQDQSIHEVLKGFKLAVCIRIRLSEEQRSSTKVNRAIMFVSKYAENTIRDLVSFASGCVRYLQPAVVYVK
jgi:hypothetical protein